MKKIAVFTGTRSEYGLLYWLLRDIQENDELTLQLIVSAMHLSPEFGLTYKQIEEDRFTIDAKVEILLSSDTSVGVAKSMGLGVLGFADALQRLQPEALVVLGDRFEALAATQTAMIMRIPVVHLHGGEITEGAYDDSIRHAITKLSHLHCTATEPYRQRVIQMGEAPERVHNVGAIGLDHLQRTKLLDIAGLGKALGFPLQKPYFLVTYHPVTLADEPPEATFLALLDALDNFRDYQIILTYPNADDGGRKIIPLLNTYAAGRSNVLAVPSLGQLRYLSAVKHATAVIGNSSSGIIEVPAFAVPTVNIGQRQKGRLAAESVIHCDAHRLAIETAIKTAISLHIELAGKPAANPYGHGNVSSRIISLLKSLPTDTVKTFHDLNKDAMRWPR